MSGQSVLVRKILHLPGGDTWTNATYARAGAREIRPGVLIVIDLDTQRVRDHFDPHEWKDANVRMADGRIVQEFENLSYESRSVPDVMGAVHE